MDVIVKTWLENKLVTAGKLRWRGDLVEFWYQQNFMEQGYALDPLRLPLADTVYHSNYRLQGDLGCFQDALPDAWGAHVLHHHFGRPVSVQEMLLADHSPQRMGALQFAKNSNESERPITHSLKWLEQYANWINSDHTSTLSDPEIGSSAGGAKPKTLVSLDGQEWLAKFSGRQDYWPTQWIEHGTLKLAQACGIETSESKVLQLKNPSQTLVLLVKRFDRDFDRDNDYRLHRLSADTLCGILRGERGEITQDNRSYLLFADKLTILCDFRQQDDRIQLFRRVAFNMFIGNYDDHSRNHAVIRGKDNRWRLSPAFDLVAGEGIQRKRLSMRIGDNGNDPSLSNLLSQTSRFGLTQQAAMELVNEIGDTIMSWRDIFEQADVPGKTIDQIAFAFTDIRNAH